MIKNIVQIESIVEEWVSNWHLPAGIPFVAAEQMLLQYLKVIGNMKDQQAAAQAAQDAAAQPVAAPSEVPTAPVSEQPTP